jgi:hypothetical protein
MPGPAGPADAEAARWEAAKQIRADYPRWVVIWAARKGEYQARPKFRAPRDTVARAGTADDLTAQMDAIEQARRRPART